MALEIPPIAGAGAVMAGNEVVKKNVRPSKLRCKARRQESRAAKALAKLATTEEVALFDPARIESEFPFLAAGTIEFLDPVPVEDSPEAAYRRACIEAEFPSLAPVTIEFFEPVSMEEDSPDAAYRRACIEAEFPFLTPAPLEFLGPVLVDVAPAEAEIVAKSTLNPEAPVFIPAIPLATVNISEHLVSQSQGKYLVVIDMIPTFLINPLQGSSPTVRHEWDPVTGSQRFFLETEITVNFIHDTPVCRVNNN